MCDEIVSAKAIFYYYQLSNKFRDVYEDAIARDRRDLASSLALRWARNAVNIITFYYVLKISPQRILPRQFLWHSEMVSTRQ